MSRTVLALALVLAQGCGTEQAKSLRVLTYNVKGLDWTNTDNPRYPVGPVTTDLVATITAQQPDLIGLQEAWDDNNDGSLAEELASATGLQHRFASTTTRGWLPYLQQNVVLSRHPLLATHELDLGPDPQSYENRRFQLVRVDAPAGELCLGNLHLFTDATLQRPALEQIRTFVAEHCPDVPLVWTGDFNFTPGDPDTYSYLTGGFTPELTDPAVALGLQPGAAELYSSSAAAPDRRIDYIFATAELAPLEYRTVTAPIASRAYPDHLPVLARFEVTR